MVLRPCDDRKRVFAVFAFGPCTKGSCGPLTLAGLGLFAVAFVVVLMAVFIGTRRRKTPRSDDRR